MLTVGCLCSIVLFHNVCLHGLREHGDGQESVSMNRIKGNVIPSTVRSCLLLLGNKLSELKRYRLLNKQRFVLDHVNLLNGTPPRVLQMPERTMYKNMQFFSGENSKKNAFRVNVYHLEKFLLIS